MIRLTMILVSGFLTLAITISSAFAGHSIGRDRRAEEIRGQEDGWTTDTSFGFTVQIGANIVINAPALSHRHIYLYIQPEDFTESNIRKAMMGVASQFTDPWELWIYAYSEKTVVEQAIRKRESGVLCVLFAQSPEGRRGSRNYGIISEPPKSGCYRAEYYRFSDSREQIEYSPDPDMEHTKKIDLRKTLPPKYSGDVAKDLNVAAEEGDAETVSALLDQVAISGITGKPGRTALMSAAGSGQMDIVRMLLARGVDINARTQAGFTALMSAAIDGNADMVKVLLERGADVNARMEAGTDGLGDTALTVAALRGHLNAVRALIAGGADIKAANIFGETALMTAAVGGFPEIVRFLADKGSDANVRDVNGRTALMLARDDRETIRALLRVGADWKAKDKDGMTALVIAIRSYQFWKSRALIEGGAGDDVVAYSESVIARDPKDVGAYRILMELYEELGQPLKAMEAGKRAIQAIPENAQLRSILGSIYLRSGDRESAMSIYRGLIALRDKAKSADKKRLYDDWAKGLIEEIGR